MEAIHIRFEAFTASFRYPLLISGTQVTTPVPAYSTLLGLVGACVGRIISPEETRIGFEFRSRSINSELERTVRWTNTGKQLKPHAKGRSISNRQVHYKPILDLYVTNTQWYHYFVQPIGTPVLGRSQDIAWITKVEKVELFPKSSGYVGQTLLPLQDNRLPGLELRLPEWFQYDRPGTPRKPGPFGRYMATVLGDIRLQVEQSNLYQPSDMDDEAKKAGHVIYIHEWLRS